MPQDMISARQFLPERQLKRLVREYPTPFFLYDERTLREQAAMIRQCFCWAQSFLPYFPVRMNPNPAILSLLAECGMGALCATASELQLAVDCGFPGRSLLFAPNRQDAQADRLCSQLEAIRLIDGVQDLPMEPPARVMLNFHPENLSGREKRLSQLVRQNRFGMTQQEFQEMAERFTAFPPEYLAVCLLTGRNETEGDCWLQGAQRLFQKAIALQEQCGRRIDGICLGEGPGVAYRTNFPQPDFPAYADGVRQLAKTLLEPAGLASAELSLLPGRLTAASAGAYFTSVVSVKPGEENPIALVDGSTAQFPRTSGLGNYHYISAPFREQEKKCDLYDVVGCLGDRTDCFGDRRLLPILRTGDLLLVHEAGTDGSSLYAGYGGWERAKEYLLTLSGRVREITPEP